MAELKKDNVQLKRENMQMRSLITALEIDLENKKNQQVESNTELISDQSQHFQTSHQFITEMSERMNLVEKTQKNIYVITKLLSQLFHQKFHKINIEEEYSKYTTQEETQPYPHKHSNGTINHSNDLPYSYND